jgi:hypothetical protein
LFIVWKFLNLCSQSLGTETSPKTVMITTPKTGTSPATPAKIVTGPQGVKMIVVQTPQQAGTGQQPQTVIIGGQAGQQQTGQPFTLQLPSSLLQSATGTGIALTTL